jgi:hypothetical protein
MKNSSVFRSALVLFFFSMILSIPLSICGQDNIEIQVSPNVLNLQNNGEVVTVHTEIPYSQVDSETVTMNGVEIDSWKADDQGNFVAKFLMSEITGLPLEIGAENELTLTGLKFDGTTFTGTDWVLVINVIPKGGKK